ncbi:MAG: translation initiation factor IF-2 [Candidatus Nomurabacteria bacterium]|nr:translation initiation factor IF-2 [Candidatus Nomurabacteria bacterium]
MKSSSLQTRPPVVAIMGHVDHGKSTLLDTIRSANTVAGEAGGITQHIAAYEAVQAHEGVDRRITFIDTPGHAAFSGMRQRGAAVADIAILIISAEDSLKPQTIEAIEIIKKAKVPFIVAINKIDRPSANVEKVKSDLLEHEVYVEGYGGDVPFAEISAKVGTGIDDLLETILILADLHEFTYDPSLPATGYVVESHTDPKRGVTATLVIKNGSLSRGQFVVAGGVYAPTRMLADFANKSLENAEASSPINVTGFSNCPIVGATFDTVKTKKEAEELIAELGGTTINCGPQSAEHSDQFIVPVIIKTDVSGTAEAVIGEIQKLNTPDIFFRVIKADVGDINESDIQLAYTDPHTLIIGFHVGRDKKIESINGINDITIKIFDIIYKMSEWIESERDNLRPKKEIETITGSAKVLKHFSAQKNNQLVGANIIDGILKVGNKVQIIRDDITIGTGRITGMQQAKSAVEHVGDGEFGTMIDSKKIIEPGDIIQSIRIDEK